MELGMRKNNNNDNDDGKRNDDAGFMACEEVKNILKEKTRPGCIMSDRKLIVNLSILSVFTIPS